MLHYGFVISTTLPTLAGNLMGDITSGYIFVPSEGTNRLTSSKLNRMGNGAVINPSFISSKPAVSGPASGDQLIMLKADGTYARVPATAFGGGATGPPGPTGPTGENAFTTTTTGFTVPAVGATVNVTVADASWAVVNEMVYVLGAGGSGLAGVLQITAISGNTLTLLNPTPAPAIPLADNTQSGLLRQVSGNVTDYVGGDNNCHALPATPPAGSGYWDAKSGFYWNDDFVNNSGTLVPQYGSQVAGGVIQLINTSTYGQDTTKKVVGYYEFTTGTTSGTNQGAALYCGMAGINNGSIVYGLGALTAKCRMFWEATLPVTAINYRFRFGLGQAVGSGYLFNAPQQSFFFEWVPDLNSGQWRVGVGGATITYSNTSVAAVADTAYLLQIDVNAAWTQITFTINGTVVAIVSSGIPLTKGNMMVSHARDTGTTNYLMAFDSWNIYYPFSR
jgi:hypothetical protein